MYILKSHSLAQIISVSIGGTSGWDRDPIALAASEAATKGVTCVISAGNSGAQGNRNFIF